MPYKRSLPAETLARIEAEITLSLPGADPGVRNSVERVLARMLAMASHEMDGYIEYVHRQILPTTCDADFLPLHGFLWKVSRLQGSFATGEVTFTGVDDSIIPQGKSLRRPSGQEYLLDADVTITGTTATGYVTATILGPDGNAPAASPITLASPEPGVQSNAILEAGLSGGVAIEDPEAWRARIVERWQSPPHGGNEADYKLWAKSVAGVTRVWTYPHQLGLGSVYLQFVMDEKADTIIPTPEEIAVVQAHLDVVRPVTADVVVGAPTPVELDFTINITPNTFAVRTAIQEELKDLIRRESVPGGTLLLSHIREAVSIAAGEVDHELVLPAANVTRTFGEISILGDITFGSV